MVVLTLQEVGEGNVRDTEERITKSQNEKGRGLAEEVDPNEFQKDLKN
jgi:hypothetical protein